MQAHEMSRQSEGKCLQEELMLPSVIQTLPNMENSKVLNSTHLPLQEG